MKLSFLPDIIKPRTHIIALLCVELFLVFSLCVPFWSNNLQSWDLMGHYYSAWFVHEHLFPNITGWNPTFYLGYEQGQFYPPLFSYLTALLGQVLPVKAAFKILVIAGILATPVSFYVLGRKWDYCPWDSVFIMILMLSLLFIISYESGVNFYSTLNVGNINHGMSVPLFFFYLACLPESIQQNRYLLVSVLMAAIVLMHPFMSVVAAFFFLAAALMCVRDTKTLFCCLRHIGLTFLMCSFWILPLLVSQRASIAPMVMFHLYAIEIVIVAFVMTVYLTQQRPDKILKRPVVKTHIAFWGIVLLAGVLQIILSYYFFEVRLRYHRFYMLYFLLLPVFACALMKELSPKLKKRVSVFLAIVAVTFALVFDETKPRGIVDVALPELEKLDGRVFIHTSPKKEAKHVAQHRLPMESGNTAIKGLFAESSGNSEYLFNLERLMLGRYTSQSEVPWWAFHWPSWRVSDEMMVHLPDYFNLFQINHVLTDTNIALPNFNVLAFKNLGPDYMLFTIGESSLFEVLDYKPELFFKERATVREWFFSQHRPRVCAALRVEVEEHPRKEISYAGAEVKIIESNELLSAFRIEVDSDKPVPILMKQTYSQRWRVVSAGEELKTYRASPYLTLFYGKGLIDIHFANTWIHILGNSLSGLGAFWLFLILVRCFRDFYAAR